MFCNSQYKYFVFFLRAKVGINTVPERAREELLMAFITMLPLADVVAFLIKWSLRHRPDNMDNDESVVSYFNRVTKSYELAIFRCLPGATIIYTQKQPQ